ncbi:MAG: cadherin domain-containing protein [Bacteroidota bacterium]
MRKKSTLRRHVLPLFATLAILSCSKDDNGGTPQEPQNNAPTIQAQSFNASEAIDDASVIGKVAATDSDGDDLSFTIKTNSNNLFEITDGGDISLATSENLDYETATSHTLSIDVTDGEATSNADVTINVIDVNENQAPTFMAQTFSAQEIVTGQGGLVATLVASDPDNDDITFSWDPNDTVTTFQLDEATGEIRTVNNSQGNLDFETTPQYVLSVIASDGELTTQADITINVTDFNDKPEASDQTFSVAEDIDNTFLIGQIVATDQDGDALTFSVDIDNDVKFDLSSTGALRLRQNTSLDFETSTSHQISIDVSDGAETIRVNVTVNVTDVVENGGTVSTLAGSTQGNTDGTGTAAQFNSPRGIYTLSNGDVYVVDNANRAIRRITSSGVVSTVFTGLRFVSPRDIVVDASDNIYVSDTGAHVIFKFEPGPTIFGSPTYIESVLAGQRGTSGYVDDTGADARLNAPRGMDIDSNGNIYVADTGNSTVRRITPSGEVTTIVSSGLSTPEDVALTPGGSVYVSDSGNNSVGVVRSNGTISRTAGGLSSPAGIVINSTDILVVSNTTNRILKIATANQNAVSVIAGVGSLGDTDGPTNQASFRNPVDIDVNQSGDLIITDTNNHRIRKIVLTN